MTLTRRTEFILRANNCRALMCQLRRVGRRVGPRSGPNKRSKTDKELFCLRRYIATLAANGQWNYPCAVEAGERPDFMIRFYSGETGLEVTECTTESFQKELTEREWTRDVVESLDDGLIGDIPEREWCEGVISAINVKVSKIKKYRPAKRHDILVYSNHPMDIVRAIDGTHPEYKRLQERAKACAPRWKSELRFGIVSIIDGQTLLYDVTGQCIQWKMVDLLP